MFEKDYTITGKHATYLKYLAKKNSKADEESEEATSSAMIYERYIDVYMNAVIFGLLNSRTAEKDTSSTSRARIYADAFSTERSNCVFLYRLVMLLDKTNEVSSEERLNKAFRYPSMSEKAEENKKNMELFNDYVRGGLEIMYEKFTEDCITKSDYIDRIYELVKDFKDEINGISYDDEIEVLLK